MGLAAFLFVLVGIPAFYLGFGLLLNFLINPVPGINVEWTALVHGVAYLAAAICLLVWLVFESRR